jgi:hypothetical protein
MGNPMHPRRLIVAVLVVLGRVRSAAIPMRNASSTGIGRRRVQSCAAGGVTALMARWSGAPADATAPGG